MWPSWDFKGDSEELTNWNEEADTRMPKNENKFENTDMNSWKMGIFNNTLSMSS